MRAFGLAFVLGTLLLQREAELPHLPYAALASVPLLACFVVDARHRIARAFLLALAGGLAGYGAAAWHAETRLADTLDRALEGRDVEITGIVSDLPQRQSQSTRFTFAPEAPPAGVPTLVSLAWYVERGRAGAAPVPPPEIRPGQRWTLTVRLKRPRGLANPHAFDFEPWALERGLRATGYVRMKPAPRIKTAHVSGWPQSLHRARDDIRTRMQAHLAGAPYAGVLVALAIGDQGAIDAGLWEVFWRTGVGHLMSISGLHITMLAALAYAVVFLGWARVPALALRLPARKAGAVSGVATALAYTLMTGFAVPAQRTLVMIAVVAAHLLLGRAASPSRVLATSAVVVLALDPWAVLAVGFWLSFGAVAAIFYAAWARTGRPGVMGAAVREQLAVTVAMLPMLVALFQEVSLVAPLANAFAIPAVSLVVVPLTLAGAFIDLGIALDVAHGILTWVIAALQAMAGWPAGMLESHAPAPWTVAAALVGAAWLLAPRGIPMRTCGFVWMAPLFAVVPPTPVPGTAWIDVLDVGNGLAVVVRTARHAFVYDAGPTWSAESDSGSRVVVPFLRGEGVRRLDGLIISHADDDHYGGAFAVAASRDPAWLLSPLPAGDPLHLVVARSVRCEAGLAWRADGVELRVLHPDASAYGEGKRRENDRSCVVRVEAAGVVALLTGDIEARAEAELLARSRGELAADVLLVPHHGSKTSSTAAFVDAVAPRMAIFSVGHRNRHRHPHPAVLGRYVERGIEVHRTDRRGALHLELGPRGALPIRGARDRPRYWSDRGLEP